MLAAAGAQILKVWPSASGGLRGLTENDGPCVVTELSLGRGVRGEEHIEEPEGGSRREQQPQQQQQHPLPWGARRPHSSPGAYCQMRQSWAGLIRCGDGRSPRASGRDSLANGGGQRLPGWDEAPGSRLGLPLVPPSSLGARGNRAGAAGGSEVHNVLLKKVRPQLGQFHSARLGGGPCPK